MCAQVHQSARKRSTSVASRKRATGPVRRTTSRKKNKTFWAFLRKMPPWTIGLGASLIGLAYAYFFYFFFVGPYSFRWKALYGEVDYPGGFDVHGIDISHYQEDVDWERLRNATIKTAPIRFVFIKATEGTSLIDENFNHNFYQAKENGFVRGAYHFFIPGADPVKQANFFLKQVNLEPGDFPPVLDVEKKGNLTKEELQKAVKIWLDIVEEKYKVKPILYTGYKFKMSYLGDSLFCDYPYWIAHYYVEKLEYKGKWSFWQHTDLGKVGGINGPVDCNIFNGTLSDMMKLTIKYPDEE